MPFFYSKADYLKINIIESMAISPGIIEKV